MKFLADEMLGKLARWLRFMGLDVIHRSPFPDDELIELARREGRIILTRDRKILEGPHGAGSIVEVEVMSVTKDLPFDQMAEIVRHFKLDPLERAFTRCAVCNHPLVERGREELAGRVPPFVFANVTEYRECPGCGKIYWSGTHRRRIEGVLSEVKEKAKKEEIMKDEL
jgi:uncharacterized protein with PIN domain